MFYPVDNSTFLNKINKLSKTKGEKFNPKGEKFNPKGEKFNLK